jgi:hypothetical protein
MFLSTSLHFSPAIIDEVGNFLNNKINYLDCAEELAALVVVQKPLDRHYETLKHLRVKEEVRPNNPVELIPELEQLGGDHWSLTSPQDKGTTCTLSSKLLSLTASLQFLTQCGRVTLSDKVTEHPSLARSRPERAVPAPSSSTLLFLYLSWSSHRYQASTGELGHR